MYPTENNVYIPSWGTGNSDNRPITLEELRDGRVVALSEDGTRATVEVKIGLAIVYCGVLMNEDGTVKDFIPRPVNKFVRVSPDKETPPTS